MKLFAYFILLFLIFTACSKKSESPSTILYQSDFSTDDGTWPNAANSTCCVFEQGHYNVMESKEGYIEYAKVPAPSLLNAGYSVKVSLNIVLDDPTLTGYGGFVYNYISTDTYKVFFITCFGDFQVYQKLNGTYTILQEWTPSSAIVKGSGAANVIQVDQHDTSIDFIVNGQNVLSLNDSHELNCKVGLAVGTDSNQFFSPVTVSFDNFTLSSLK